MKKVFLLLIIFIVSLPNLFSEDNKRNILEGSWAEDVTCDYYIKSGEPYKVEIVNGEKALQECFLIIKYPTADKKGFIRIDSLAVVWIIENIEVIENKVKFYCIPRSYDDQEGILQEIIVTLIDDYEISVDGLGYSDWVHFYHFSNTNQTTESTAKVNDSRVRLRTKPNLKSKTWKLLEKGTSVKIKDISASKEKIDGESFYWYKVDIENEPDGWVYGKYLDISK